MRQDNLTGFRRIGKTFNTQARAVRNVDNAIHRRNHHLPDSLVLLLTFIHWIALSSLRTAGTSSLNLKHTQVSLFLLYSALQLPVEKKVTLKSKILVTNPLFGISVQKHPSPLPGSGGPVYSEASLPSLFKPC